MERQQEKVNREKYTNIMSKTVYNVCIIWKIGVSESGGRQSIFCIYYLDVYTLFREKKSHVNGAKECR